MSLAAAVAYDCVCSWPMQRERRSDEFDVPMRRLLLLLLLPQVIRRMNLSALLGLPLAPWHFCFNLPLCRLQQLKQQSLSSSSFCIFCLLRLPRAVMPTVWLLIKRQGVVITGWYFRRNQWGNRSGRVSDNALWNNVIFVFSKSQQTSNMNTVSRS